MLEEGSKVFLYCFVVVGVVICYQVVYVDEVEDILVLDIVLCCNDIDWFEYLLLEIDS